MVVDDDRAQGRSEKDPQGEDEHSDSQRERRRGSGETVAAAGAAGVGLGAGAAAGFVGTSEALDQLIDDQETVAEEPGIASSGPDAEDLDQMRERLEDAEEAARALTLDVFESRGAAVELPEGVADPNLIVGDSVPASSGDEERSRPEDAVPLGGGLPGGPPPIGRPRGDDAPDDGASPEGPGAAPGAPEAPEAGSAPPPPSVPGVPSVPEPPAAGPGSPPPPPAGPSGGGDAEDVVTGEQPSPPAAPAVPEPSGPSEGAAPPSSGSTEAPGTDPGDDAPVGSAPPSAPGSTDAPPAPPAGNDSTAPPSAPAMPGTSADPDEPESPPTGSSPAPPASGASGGSSAPPAPVGGDSSHEAPAGLDDETAYPYVVDWSVDGGWVEVLARNQHGDVLRYRYDTDGSVYYIDAHGNYHALHDERLAQLLYVDDHGVGYFAFPHQGDTVYFSLDTHGQREWLDEHEIPGYADEEDGYDYPRVIDYEPGWAVIAYIDGRVIKYYVEGGAYAVDEHGNETPVVVAEHLVHVDANGTAYFVEHQEDGDDQYSYIDTDGGQTNIYPHEVPGYEAPEEEQNDDYPRVTQWSADEGWVIIYDGGGHYTQYYLDGRVRFLDEQGNELLPNGASRYGELISIDEYGRAYFRDYDGDGNTAYLLIDHDGGIEYVDEEDVPAYDGDEEPPLYPRIHAYDADAGWAILEVSEGEYIKYYEGGGAYYVDDLGNEYPVDDTTQAQALTLIGIDSQGNAYFHYVAEGNDHYNRLDAAGNWVDVQPEDIPGYEQAPEDDEPPANGDAAEVRYFLAGYGDGYPHPADVYDEPDEIREENARTVHIYNAGLTHVDYRPDGRTFLYWYDEETGVLDMQIFITPQGEVQIQVYPHEYALDHFDRIIDTSGLGDYAYPDPDATGMAYDEVFQSSRIVRTYEDGTVKIIYNYDDGRIDIWYPDGTVITDRQDADPRVVTEGDGGYAPPGVDGPEGQDAPDDGPVGEDDEIVEGSAYDLNYVYSLIPDTQPVEFEGGFPNPEHDASYQYHDTIIVGAQPVHLLSNGAGRTIAVQENSDGTATLHWYNRPPDEIGLLGPDGLEASAVIYPNGSYRLGYPENGQPDEDPPLEEAEIVDAEENYLPDWLPLEFDRLPSPAQEGFTYQYTAVVEGYESHVYSDGQYVIAFSDYGNGAGRILIDAPGDGEGWDAGFELFNYGEYERMEEYGNVGRIETSLEEMPEEGDEAPQDAAEDLQFTEEDEAIDGEGEAEQADGTAEPLTFEQPESAAGDEIEAGAETEDAGEEAADDEATAVTAFETGPADIGSEDDEPFAGDTGEDETLETDDQDDEPEL